MRTIKEVSEITGASIRTLRYYDEIGLLKPTELSAAGYRLYDKKELEKMQEIMFFRELEVPLEEIKEIMENPNYDKKQALLVQRSLLERKRDRLNGIIQLITDVMEGINTMSFENFMDNDIQVIIENMRNGVSQEQFDDFIQKYGGGSVEAYEQNLLEALNDEKTKASMLKWYGGKEKVIEGHKPIPDMEELRVQFDQAHKDFYANKEHAGNTEEKYLVAKLAELYQQMLNMDNARNFLLDLAKEYLENSKIAEAQDDQYGQGATQYMAEAIQRYYGV